MIKRRSFLTYFSLGWFTSCFPVVLAACTPGASKSSTSTVTENPPVGDDKVSAKPVVDQSTAGFITVGTVAELDKTGQLQIKDVAVVRDPANPQRLVAVNPKCTHKGCTVKWMSGEKKYDCPCHDAEFAADGKLLKGPATEALKTYPAKIVGTQVLVKV